MKTILYSMLTLACFAGIASCNPRKPQATAPSKMDCNVSDCNCSNGCQCSAQCPCHCPSPK